MTVHLEISDSKDLSWIARCVGGYLACGLKNREISKRMGVNIRTVERAVMALRAAIDAPREIVGVASTEISPVHDSPPSDKKSPIDDNMSHSTGSVNMSDSNDKMSQPPPGTDVATREDPSDPISPTLPSSPKDGSSKKKDKKDNGQFKESDFIEFYAAYPKHVSKKGARTKYETVRKSGVIQQQLLDGVDRFKAHNLAEGTKAQFICAPDVWLNKGRWDDEYDQTATAKYSGTEEEMRERYKDSF